VLGIARLLHGLLLPPLERRWLAEVAARHGITVTVLENERSGLLPSGLDQPP
jgi:hypothetical protein